MNLPLCECGYCGERVSKPGNRFVFGHNRRGKTASNETLRKISEAKKGKKHTEATRRKMSKAKSGDRHPNWGKTASNKTRRKMLEVKKGRPSGMLGKAHTEEAKRKIGKANRGNKNPRWLGGKSFEPYGPEFNSALKLAIRERDRFNCQFCGEPENGRAHDCHHIDYVKVNNAPGNLNTLCHPCHVRTNTNRAFWTKLFQARMKMGLRLDENQNTPPDH